MAQGVKPGMETTEYRLAVRSLALGVAVQVVGLVVGLAGALRGGAVLWALVAIASALLVSGAAVTAAAVHSYARSRGTVKAAALVAAPGAPPARRSL